MALLFYGAGLRILECARLRIKDVDFDRRLLTLQDTRGGRNRVTMLPEAARGPLRDQIRYARELYDADRSGDLPGVQLPQALEWKSKKASTAWEWFWVFLTHRPAGPASRNLSRVAFGARLLPVI